MSFGPLVLVSGGFDPLHEGHIQLFQDAATYGRLGVVLNSDAWLTRKKGAPFQTFETRFAILRAIRYVDFVLPADDSDGTVRAALRLLRPDYFANGGDRTEANTPEVEICKELGIRVLFNVGGGKAASSSELLARWKERNA